MMDPIETLYFNHIQSVMLAARFAQLAGLKVGIGEDPLDLNWPVIYISLPDGQQVSWRIPPDELEGEWPVYGDAHDGHSAAERRDRITAYLQDLGLFQLEMRAHYKEWRATKYQDQNEH